MTNNEHRDWVAWGIISAGVTYVTWTPEREERKTNRKNIFEEVMANIFSNWWKL